jgi:hypothetical protein
LLRDRVRELDDKSLTGGQIVGDMERLFHALKDTLVPRIGKGLGACFPKKEEGSSRQECGVKTLGHSTREMLVRSPFIRRADSAFAASPRRARHR